MNLLMHFPKPRLLIYVCFTLFFCALIVFFGYAAVKLWRDDVEASDKPEPMALAEAVERSQNDTLWVDLYGTEGLLWDCSSVVHWSEETTNVKWTDVALTDQNQSLVLLVSLKDHRTCDQIIQALPSLHGELSRVAARDFDDLNFEGRLSKYPASATVLKLCTYCNPHKSQAIIGVSLFCLLGSVFAMGYSLKEAFDARRTIRAEAALAAADLTYQAPASTRISRSEADALLMRVFGFDEQDLAANQSGVLSPRQQRRLFMPLPDFIKLVVMFIVVVALILLGIEYMATTSSTEKHIVSGVVIVLSVVGLILDIRSRQRVFKGKISSVCGSLTLKVNKMGDLVEHSAIIDGKTFAIDFSQYAALVEGRPYCFYFIELAGYTRGKTVLSIIQQ